MKTNKQKDVLDSFRRHHIVMSNEVTRDLVKRWASDITIASDLVRLYKAAVRLASARSITTEREHTGVEDTRDKDAILMLREAVGRLEEARRGQRGSSKRVKHF